jgi:hypothetical protein
MGVHVTDEDILDVARRYDVLPGSLKSLVFALLEKGLSRAEARFVLRDRKKRDDSGTFAATVRSYYAQWRKRQAEERDG